MSNEHEKIMPSDFFALVRDALSGCLYTIVMSCYTDNILDIKDDFSINGQASLQDTLLCNITLNTEHAKLEITSYHPIDSCAMGFFTSIDLSSPDYGEKLKCLLNEIKLAKDTQRTNKYNHMITDNSNPWLQWPWQQGSSTVSPFPLNPTVTSPWTPYGTSTTGIHPYIISTWNNITT